MLSVLNALDLDLHGLNKWRCLIRSLIYVSGVQEK